MLESRFPSFNTNTDTKSAAVSTEENSDQHKKNKCTTWCGYFLSVVPTTVAIGVSTSQVSAACCAISASRSLLLSGGIMTCAIVSCSSIYCAMCKRYERYSSENETKTNNNNQDCVKLSQPTGTTTEQPESQNSNRRNSDSSTSIYRSFASLNNLDDTAIVEAKHLETYV